MSDHKFPDSDRDRAQELVQIACLIAEVDLSLVQKEIFIHYVMKAIHHGKLLGSMEEVQRRLKEIREGE